MNSNGKFKSEIALFMILFLTGSFTVTNDLISSAMTIGLWVVTAIVLLASFQYIDLEMLIILVIIIFTVIISNLFNNENIRNTFAILFSFFTAFLYANIYGFETFKSSYIKVIKVLSIISLMGFVLFYFIPSLGNYFIAHNAVGNRYSNLYIYADGYSIERNQGMFWEPGAFQTFIILALLFEINGKEPDIKTIIIFFITVITTFSTTGYIGLVLIMLMIMKKSRQVDSRLKAFMVISIIALCILLFFNSDEFFATDKSTVFGKLINFFRNNEYNNTSKTTSASIRFNAVVRPLIEFFKNPFFGCGYEGLIEKTKEYTHGMNTCTFINWFATYGIVFGVIMLSGTVKFAKKINQNGLLFWLTLLILFVATMSENYVNNATIMLLAFYGFRQQDNLENENENIAVKQL